MAEEAQSFEGQKLGLRLATRVTSCNPLSIDGLLGSGPGVALSAEELSCALMHHPLGAGGHLLLATIAEGSDSQDLAAIADFEIFLSVDDHSPGTGLDDLTTKELLNGHPAADEFLGQPMSSNAFLEEILAVVEEFVGDDHPVMSVERIEPKIGSICLE